MRSCPAPASSRRTCPAPKSVSRVSSTPLWRHLSDSVVVCTTTGALMPEVQPSVVTDLSVVVCTSVRSLEVVFTNTKVRDGRATRSARARAAGQ